MRNNMLGITLETTSKGTVISGDVSEIEAANALHVYLRARLSGHTTEEASKIAAEVITLSRMN